MYKVLYTQSVGETSAHGPRPKAPRRSERAQVLGAQLPRWLKTTVSHGPNYVRVRDILQQHGLHSVCQEAACPNIRECWEAGTATFMILGKYCTRNCNFCDVLHGQPLGLDEDEPQRVAEVVSKLNLKQIVITSVTRDDLPDGGASIFARTIELLRRQVKDVKVELLHQNYATGCDIVTIGQYLRPSPLHLPVEKYYHPDEFRELAEIGRQIGFAHFEAGPLVRSSYKAFDQSKELLEKTC